MAGSLSKSRHTRLLSCSAAVALLVLAGPAFAQTAPASTAANAPSPNAPSPNATVNLIRLLVRNKVLTAAQGAELLHEAETEAAQAQAQEARAVPTAPPVAVPVKSEPPPPPTGTQRISYVPEVVKRQIVEQVRSDVMTQARNDNWAQPEQVPAWTKHFTISGDLRVRHESDLYSGNNIGPCGDSGSSCSYDSLVNFAAFNANGPTDVGKTTNPSGLPFLNTRDNRPSRLSYRARLNLAANVTDGVMFDIQLASGQTNGPVSTTQLLGGGWDKNDVWLDLAYIKLSPGKWGNIFAGRMPNPFLHTDIVYDEDLNFDGIAYTGAWNVSHGLVLGGSAGIFPLEYGAPDFPNNTALKGKDVVKWMQGGQITAEWSGRSWNWKTGIGYYDFEHVRGQLSSPCALYNGNSDCDTDQTRPAFMQKGNTVFLLRDIIPDPSLAAGVAGPLPQYAGLSFDYNLINLTSKFSVNVGDRYQLSLVGDYVHNLAYDPKDAYSHTPLGTPVNNLRANATDTTVPAGLQSGGDGYQARLQFGYEKPRELWEWNLFTGYRYLEPDAVLDSLTDSDFHLGGTNAKGYFIGGSLGLFHNTYLTARWMSANEVFGPPLAIDVFQFDLNTGL